MGPKARRRARLLRTIRLGRDMRGARWAARGLVAAALAGALAGSVRADDLKDGKVALQAGRLEDALKSFERAAGQGYGAGRAGVGQVWLRRRQYDKAREQFEQAQKMEPSLA